MEKLAFVVIGGAIGVVLTIALQTSLGSPGPGAPAMSQMQMQDAAAMPTMSHQHPLRPAADGAPVPAVSHLVFPDVSGGYNVQILAQNFRFTPAAINTAAQQNEGHAHIYVNGVKYARVYSDWFHLPAEALQPGMNEVRVTLNANDHSEWAVDGAAVAATVMVTRPE